MLGSSMAAAVLAAQNGGFDPFQFVGGAAFWTWVIFLLSLPVMWKFVFGPITRALSERDQQVVDAAKAAEQARSDAEHAVAAARGELEQARAEAKRMVQDGIARAERQARQAQQQAKAEAERQLQKVREDIETEKRRALVEIRREVVDLAIASAGRILERDVDDDTHRMLVGGFLADLGSRSRS